MGKLVASTGLRMRLRVSKCWPRHVVRVHVKRCGKAPFKGQKDGKKPSVTRWRASAHFVTNATPSSADGLARAACVQPP
eukprot:240762-Chlamydomonas_euryale.AAC.1